MPKNKIGGNKSKKQKNTVPQENNNFPLADNPDLLYALVLKKLGGKNISLKCSDGKERVGRICGSMWKRSFMQIGDFVLISKRDFSTTDNKCDILHKYQPHHANTIITTYNISSLKNDKSYHDNTTGFLFQENDDDDDDDNNDDDDYYNDNIKNKNIISNNSGSENESNSDVDSNIDVDNI